MIENRIQIIQTFDGCEPRKFEGELEMDMLKQIVGDGNSKLTVGRTFSDKEYGNGGETFMSVTITCNQDAESMSMAADIAKAFIDAKLPTFHSEGLALWAQNKTLNTQIMKA